MTTPSLVSPVHIIYSVNDCLRHLFGLPASRWEQLKGKGFWITGGGTGYGRAIATALAAAGAIVYLSGRRADMLEEARSEILDLGFNTENIILVPMDITKESSVIAGLEVVLSGPTTLTGLLHCAALPPSPCQHFSLLEITLDQWQAQLATNVTGPWLVTRTVLETMAKRGNARIIFFTSSAAWNFTPGAASYAISKTAVNCLGASFAAEAKIGYPEADIQINIIDPGQAKSEMNQGSDESPFSVVPMVMLLLTHPLGGPNGKFFDRNGNHLSFLTAEAWESKL